MDATQNITETRFTTNYSAQRNTEAERIRSKYVHAEDTPLGRLRALDREAELPGTIAALVLGVVGCLALGAGMSAVMVLGGTFMAPGIVLGVIGMAIAGAAYPVYTHITNRKREELAPEINRLADELR